MLLLRFGDLDFDSWLVPETKRVFMFLEIDGLVLNILLSVSSVIKTSLWFTVLLPCVGRPIFVLGCFLPEELFVYLLFIADFFLLLDKSWPLLFDLDFRLSIMLGLENTVFSKFSDNLFAYLLFFCDGVFLCLAFIKAISLLISLLRFRESSWFTEVSLVL